MKISLLTNYGHFFLFWTNLSEIFTYDVKLNDVNK